MTLTIALLSHRGGNIGHDFMAAGMAEIVNDAFGAAVKIVHYEQHRPFEVYAPGQWIRLFNRLPHGRGQLIRRYLARDTVRERLWQRLPQMHHALAIACGGPNLVPGAAKALEMRLLLHHMNGAFARQGVPLIDAGVGSAFPLDRPPYRLTDPEDRTFYRQALSYVTRITVREQYAQATCADLGVDAPLIPCAAIGVGRTFERLVDRSVDQRCILINFQAHGANSDRGQNVDVKWWRDTVRRAIADLRRRHTVRLLAHDAYEARLARQLAPDLTCSQPANVEDYARAIAGAKAAFVSRIHAAVPLAGIGVPSLVVGTDTRIATAGTLGLPTMPVKSSSTEAIVEGVEQLIAKISSERERLRQLREDAMQRYAELFRSHAR